MTTAERINAGAGLEALEYVSDLEEYIHTLKTEVVQDLWFLLNSMNDYGLLTDRQRVIKQIAYQMIGDTIGE